MLTNCFEVLTLPFTCQWLLLASQWRDSDFFLAYPALPKALAPIDLLAHCIELPITTGSPDSITLLTRS
jgi:hypothetical protein